MQTGAGRFSEQGVVIAPDPARSNYDIEIPWLVTGERAQSQALDDLDMSSLKALLRHPGAVDPEGRDASVHAGSRIAESREDPVLAQSVPSTQVVSDIVERIEKYIGINNFENSTSRFVNRYLKERCYGQQIRLNEDHIVADLIQSNSGDYIARYLSKELMRILLQPTCVKIGLSSTVPFVWKRDVPLVNSSKTIFRLVATVNDFEREFAVFLDHCEDVIRFTSLAVADRRSLVIRDVHGSPFPSILPCDPDWIIVSRHNGDLRYWIASTKDRPRDMQDQRQFMATEWCEIAKRTTGQCWRYIHVDPARPLSEFPSLQALNVHHVARTLSAFRAAQKIPTSLDEMLRMRDEGRRPWNS